MVLWLRLLFVNIHKQRTTLVLVSWQCWIPHIHLMTYRQVGFFTLILQGWQSSIGAPVYLPIEVCFRCLPLFPCWEGSKASTFHMEVIRAPCNCFACEFTLFNQVAQLAHLFTLSHAGAPSGSTLGFDFSLVTTEFKFCERFLFNHCKESTSPPL